MFFLNFAIYRKVYLSALHKVALCLSVYDRRKVMPLWAVYRCVNDILTDNYLKNITTVIHSRPAAMHFFYAQTICDRCFAVN